MLMSNNLPKEPEIKDKSTVKIATLLFVVGIMVVSFIFIYTALIKLLFLNSQFEVELEEEMTVIKDQVSIYYDNRLNQLKTNIADNIRAYKNNIDPFLNRILRIDTMFVSGWNGFMEWFSDDKEKVERYLIEIWGETMFSDEDIDFIIDTEIEQAIFDMQLYTGELIKKASVILFEKSEKTMEEIEEQLNVEINKDDEFVDFDMRGLKLTASLPLSNLIFSGIAGNVLTKLVTKGVGAVVGKTGAAVSSTATFGVGLLVGFALDQAIDSWQKHEFRKNLEQTIDTMADSISENVYLSIVSPENTEVVLSTNE